MRCGAGVLVPVFVLASLAPLGSAQATPITSERLAPEQRLPAPIKAKGKRVIGAWRFAGPGKASGYLVLSSTSRAGKAGEGRQLFAQLYTGTKPAQVRLVQDGIAACQLDMTASFVQGSVSFEDIDGDGTVEVGFAYDLGCDATERPTPRKLLVLEGTAKHALRGNGRGKDLDDKPAGGDYKADGFKNEGAIATWAEARWNELLETPAINVDP
jgi:hypothetical protein